MIMRYANLVEVKGGEYRYSVPMHPEYAITVLAYVHDVIIWQGSWKLEAVSCPSIVAWAVAEACCDAFRRWDEELRRWNEEMKSK